MATQLWVGKAPDTAPNDPRTDPSAWSVTAARELTRRMLGGNRERMAHTAAVAARATSLRDAVPARDVDLLVAAAWLHDIGYAHSLRDTGFHPVDGARFLRSIGWDPAVCDLVAHHSGSRFVAPLRDLDGELGDFAFVEGPVSDALTVADQTVGPNGRSMTLDERMRDQLERHASDPVNARAHPHRELYFRSAFRRVLTRLERAGADPLR